MKFSPWRVNIIILQVVHGSLLGLTVLRQWRFYATTIVDVMITIVIVSWLGRETRKGAAPLLNNIIVDDCHETTRDDCILIAFAVVDVVDTCKYVYVYVYLGTGLQFESTTRWLFHGSSGKWMNYKNNDDDNDDYDDEDDNVGGVGVYVSPVHLREEYNVAARSLRPISHASNFPTWVGYGFIPEIK